MRVALFSLAGLGLTTAVAVAQTGPSIGGGITRPWASPPGWFGPGPSYGRGWGPGNDWNYYGVNGGPYVNGYAGYPGWYGGYGRGFGPGYYPGFWGIPGAAGSFWTNGLSLYGPPVPTYGPTPGSFGGSDAGKQFFRNPPPANGVWVGLGWSGYRSPSPRRFTPSVNVWPTGAPSVAVLAAPPAATPTGAPCIRLAVKVPDPAADVWVEKKAMTQTGTDRSFESPPLETGKPYTYEVLARWTENGVEKTESRTVTARAGETVKVDFGVPDAVVLR